MLGAVLRSWLYLALRDWRERYPSLVSMVAEALALGMSLLVYWYTARAFSGRAAFAGQDYFSYVVLGEATLMLPFGLVSGVLRSVREAQAEGVLEAMLTLPWSGTRTLLLLGAPGALREAARACVFLGVAVLLGDGLATTGLLGWGVLQLAAMPVFVAFGVMATACFFRFGRGEGALAFASTLAAVLAGAYFPVALFPEGAARALSVLSPFNVLLEAARAAISAGGQVVQLGAMARLLLFGLLAMPLAVLGLGMSLRSIRRRGAFP